MPIKQWRKLRDKENKDKKPLKNLLTKKRFYAGVAVILIAILLLGIGLRARKNALQFEKDTTADLTDMLEQLSDMEAVIAESKETIHTIESTGSTSEEVSNAIDNCTSETEQTINNSTETVNKNITQSTEGINNNVNISRDILNNSINSAEESINNNVSNSCEEINNNITGSTEEISNSISENAKEINTHLDAVQNNISDTKTEITDLLNVMDKSRTKEIQETYARIKADFGTLTTDFNTSMDDVKNLLFSLSAQSREQYEDTIETINDLQTEVNSNNTNNVKMLNEIRSNDDDNTKTILDKFTAFSTSLKQEFASRMDASDQKMTAKDAELQAQIDAISAKVNSVDTYYPIGSLYLSLSNENPGNIWGGSWQLVAQGQSLMGSGNGFALGTSGGSYDYTLTQANLPNYNLTVNDPGHGHSVNDPGHAHSYTTLSGTDVADRYPSFTALTGTAGATTSYSQTGISINGSTTGISVNSGGADQAFSLLSPYLVVNVWKRVA